MPISQSRMISLLNAASDYRQALEAACQFIQRQTQEFHDGKCTAEQALFEIERRASPRLALEFPDVSPGTIGIEHYHFRANRARNNRARIREERKRRDAGIPARQRSDMPFQSDHLRRFNTNPESLARPSPLANARRSQIDQEVDAAWQRMQRKQGELEERPEHMDENMQRELDGNYEEDVEL